MEDNTTPQESPKFSGTEKMEMGYVIPMKLAIREDTPVGECMGFSTTENVTQEPKVTLTSRHDSILCETQDFSPIDKLPQESEAVKITATREPETRESTGFEIYGCEPEMTYEASPPLDKSLAFGDLVVVDYAEKKKLYKYPAIVYSSSTFLMEDCAAGTHDR